MPLVGGIGGRVEGLVVVEFEREENLAGHVNLNHIFSVISNSRR
jgi:hypothetical protein